MQYTKGKLTAMAKHICKVNEVLADAIAFCEDISHDEDIKTLLENKDQYSEEYDLLVERIQKYSKYTSSSDARLYGADLDDATDILGLAFEDIE